MRTGDLIAGIVVALVAIFAITIWAAPACGCTLAQPFVDRAPHMVGLGGAARVVADFERARWESTRSFAVEQRELDGLPISDAIDVRLVKATRTSYAVELTGMEFDVGRRCLVEGAAPSPGSENRFTLHCVDAGRDTIALIPPASTR